MPAATVCCSRVRKAAALYALPPARTGRRGRPTEKGARWPSWAEMGRAAPFVRGRVVRYGRAAAVWRHSFVCLWWAVSKPPIGVVLVRDRAGGAAADYLFHDRGGAGGRAGGRGVGRAVGRARGTAAVAASLGLGPSAELECTGRVAPSAVCARGACFGARGRLAESERGGERARGGAAVASPAHALGIMGRANFCPLQPGREG